MPRKSKDDIDARLDLVSMRIRRDLGPAKKETLTYLPHVVHTLSRKIKFFCKFLHGAKVPKTLQIIGTPY